MPKAWPLVFALLIGCGGGGGAALLEGSSGTIATSFSNASSFNGNTSALTSYTTLDGSVNGNTITISVQNVDRNLETSFISPNLASGTTVDLSGSTGSVVVYSDTNGTWGATSGTVTVVSHTSTGVQLQFTNVVLTNESGGATGSVTLSGTVTFVAG
jgi:hypothetical protein